MLIIDVITAQNWFWGMKNLYVDTKKHISTFYGSKVMAHCLAVVAILDVALQRQMHKVKFWGLLICCSGGAQDAIPQI